MDQGEIEEEEEWCGWGCGGEERGKKCGKRDKPVQARENGKERTSAQAHKVKKTDPHRIVSKKI